MGHPDNLLHHHAGDWIARMTTYVIMMIHADELVRLVDLNAPSENMIRLWIEKGEMVIWAWSSGNIKISKRLADQLVDTEVCFLACGIAVMNGPATAAFL
jgi:hypothetical protein